jgi:hypothetical protein
MTMEIAAFGTLSNILHEKSSFLEHNSGTWCTVQFSIYLQLSSHGGIYMSMLRELGTVFFLWQRVIGQ